MWLTHPRSRILKASNLSHRPKDLFLVVWIVVFDRRLVQNSDLITSTSLSALLTGECNDNDAFLVHDPCLFFSHLPNW